MRLLLVLILALGAAPIVAQTNVRDTVLYRAVQSGELNRTNVRIIQRELQALGYRPGFADGIFGPRTQRTIAEWQRDTGQRVNGLGLAPGEVAEVARAICGDGRLRIMRGGPKKGGGVCY